MHLLTREHSTLFYRIRFTPVITALKLCRVCPAAFLANSFSSVLPFLLHSTRDDYSLVLCRVLGTRWSTCCEFPRFTISQSRFVCIFQDTNYSNFSFCSFQNFPIQYGGCWLFNLIFKLEIQYCIHTSDISVAQKAHATSGYQWIGQNIKYFHPCRSFRRRAVCMLEHRGGIWSSSLRWGPLHDFCF